MSSISQIRISKTIIQAVEKILKELGLQDKPTLRVFNKEDLFPDKKILDALSSRFQAIPVSALNPKSLPALLEKIEDVITG